MRECPICKLRLLPIVVALFIFLLIGAFLYFSPRQLPSPAEAPIMEATLPDEDVSVSERAYRLKDVGKMAGSYAPPSPKAIKVALTRKLIREAWLTLMVQDVPKVAQQVRQIAEQLDGYVAQISQSREPKGEWRAELILRVPSERYHEALSKLQQLGQVEDLREQVQDVTEEFIDLEARLRNLKRSEQHLLELLKRTGKVSDLLQVERELSQRRSEIERIEGRLRYLTHQTNFSTINVTLKEFRARPIPETAFSVSKVFGDAFRTAVLILRGILVALIWVIVFGIFWLPLSLFAWWWAKRMRQVEETAKTGGSE
ncbi:MAG: DUF4349 domain-containing protein [Armatimonadetes bacterium]|nr:DUF4349 domain-containing protein [Armatimonadota bacterium]